MEKWQTKRILILGTTYPAHSTKHMETVCTGGIFEDTLEMVRLYPVPARYLEPANQFHAFQMIEARVCSDPSDPRPESYRIEADSIKPMEKVSDHDIRRSFLDRSPHFCLSVEELLRRQKANQTSLGIIIPDSITNCSVERRSESERLEWAASEKARQDQERLFGTKPKPLDFPEVKFVVSWICKGGECEGHNMSLHQWGIHELYRKVRAQPDWEEKVLARMRQRLDEGERDIYMFLGNFRGVMYNFGLMDTYSAPTRNQITGSLFTLPGIT